MFEAVVKVNLFFQHKIQLLLAYDDVWDDSALIKAYDKAISLAKDEVNKRLDAEEEQNGTKPNKSQSQKHNRQSQKTQKVLI